MGEFSLVKYEKGEICGESSYEIQRVVKEEVVLLFWVADYVPDSINFSTESEAAITSPVKITCVRFRLIRVYVGKEKSRVRMICL